jgi:lysophospholipase L1-like esterase
LKDVYQRTRTKFIPLDPKQDTFFKEQQQKDPDAFFRTQIESVCSVAISNQIKPVLIYIPTIEQLNAAEPSNVFRVKTQVSQRFGVPFLDMTPDIKPEGKELYLEGDLAHLNVKGNELVAKRLYPILTKLLSL